MVIAAKNYWIVNGVVDLDARIKREQRRRPQSMFLVVQGCIRRVRSFCIEHAVIYWPMASPQNFEYRADGKESSMDEGINVFDAALGKSMRRLVE